MAVNRGEIAILGVPTELGNPAHKGMVAQGVEYMRNPNRGQVGIVEFLEHLGFRVTDMGDVECSPGEAAADAFEHDRGTDPSLIKRILEVSEDAARRVREAVLARKKVLPMGGDHSMSLGTISGAAVALKELYGEDAELGVIMIDAHGDFHDRESSKSKHVHGMHLEYLTGHPDDKLAQILDTTTKVKPENVLVIGCNDLDPGELERMREKGVRVLTANELRTVPTEDGRHIPADIVNTLPIIMAIREIRERVKGFWITSDNDGISAADAPGTPMQNWVPECEEGATSEEECQAWLSRGIDHESVLQILDIVRYECRNIVGFEMPELAPEYERIDGPTTLDLSHLMIETLFIKRPDRTLYPKPPAGI